jgi:hypothetical protein
VLGAFKNEVQALVTSKILTPTQPICLVKRVNDLILVARNEARLEALAKRLTSQTERLVTLRADLRVKAERKQR